MGWAWLQQEYGNAKKNLTQRFFLKKMTSGSETTLTSDKIRKMSALNDIDGFYPTELV